MDEWEDAEANMNPRPPMGRSWSPEDILREIQNVDDLIKRFKAYRKRAMGLYKDALKDVEELESQWSLQAYTPQK